jgi:histidine triad (HIT) family protein
MQNHNACKKKENPMTTAYEQDNIFAKILRGEIPAHVLYEDDHTLSFMDIMPRAKGHALVIPKEPSRTFLDLDATEIGALYQTVQKIAKASKKAFQADGITIHQFNEKAGGQVIFHTHVHVIPRFEGEDLKPHTGQVAPDDVLAPQAEAIRAILGEF